MKSEKLIQSQIEQTRQIINQVEKLKSNSLHTLTWKQNRDSWNILECLAHLNLYGNFYLARIEAAIRTSKTKKEDEFKSGFLGSYFSKSMLPKEKLNKMKTFKSKNPINVYLDKTTIDSFIDQQLKLIELLNQAQKVSLNKVKIRTTLSFLPKLRLGDTFQFIINHNIRHLKQIERIQAEMKIG